MTTISEERVERGAKAAAEADGFIWEPEHYSGVRGFVDEYTANKFRKRIRAALIADAPAILAAKIEGLKIASEIARTMKTLKVWFGMAIADEIDARIASLEAEMKEGGK